MHYEVDIELTRFFVQHLDSVIQMSEPKVPLASSEAQLLASDLHVSQGPIP